jgi:hypothetical protein
MSMHRTDSLVGSPRANERKVVASFTSMPAHRPRISNTTTYSSTTSFFIDSFQVIEGSFTLGVINEHPEEIRFEEMPGGGSREEWQRAIPNIVEPVARLLASAFDVRTFDEGQEVCATT